MAQDESTESDEFITERLTSHSRELRNLNRRIDDLEWNTMCTFGSLFTVLVAIFIMYFMGLFAPTKQSENWINDNQTAQHRRLAEQQNKQIIIFREDAAGKPQTVLKGTYPADTTMRELKEKVHEKRALEKLPDIPVDKMKIIGTGGYRRYWKEELGDDMTIQDYINAADKSTPKWTTIFNIEYPSNY